MKDLEYFKNVFKSVVGDAKGDLKLEETCINLDALSQIVHVENLSRQVAYLQVALATISKSQAFYKFLTKLFAETTEKARQQFFNDLINWCFLEQKSSSLTRAEFERQVKILLPLVKIQTLLKNPRDEELLKNVQNYFNSPRLNQEDIYQAVKTYLGNSNYNLQSYKLIPLDQRNGHLGDYFHLKVTVNNETLDWFAKFMVSHTEYLKEVLDRGPSKKEEFFYMEFVPQIRQFGLLDFAPNCHFSRVDDLLILDDVAAGGFVGLPPHTQLSLSDLKLTLKQFAKLHACSFLFEATYEKSLYGLYKEYLEETIFALGSPEYNKSFDKVTSIILYMGSEFPELLGHKYAQNDLRTIAENWRKVVLKQLAKSQDNINVICHGDAYVANLLFKFTKDKIGEAVKLIDFQLLRYQPPMLEVLFFLYQNAAKEIIDANLDSLLQDYYSNLSDILQRHNLDISKVLPKNVFDKSKDPMSVTALYMSLYYSSVLCLAPTLRAEMLSGKYGDIHGFEVVKVGLETDENYRRVMMGIFVRFVELCDKGLLIIMR